MRKQVILIMEGSQYPFGQADQSTNNRSKIQSRILVRKKHGTSSLQERNQILDKIHIIKNISTTHLMKIETVLEQENSIHILYEYVPNCLIRKIKALPEQTIHKIRDQLWQLGNLLGDMGVVVEWDKKNIGITDKMETKYYLDLQTIKIESKINKNMIQKQHFQIIMNLFPQFSQSKQVNDKITSLQKQLYLPIGEKKQINPNSNTLLYAREANSIDSKYDIQHLKKQVANQIVASHGTSKIPEQFKTPDRVIQRNKNNKISPDPEKNINKELQRNSYKEKQRLKEMQKLKEKQREKQRERQRQKEKEKERQRERQSKIPMRNSKHNWKQIEQNSQFLQDFINVLDDKSQNAKSKYISDEQLDEQGQKHGKESQKNNSNEQQQIVWMSAPEKQERQEQEELNQANYGTYEMNRSTDEEIVWVDYRDFRDIRERAVAAIKRSSNALQVFRNILSKYK